MRGLNLGSGEHADVVAPDWVSVDKFDMAHWPRSPDVIADVFDGLPFPDDWFDRAYLGHFLEHLDYESEVPAALDEVRRVCRDGADVRVVGPCYRKAVLLQVGEGLLSIIRPPARYTEPRGIEHRWLPTTEATLDAVRYLDPDAREVSVTTVAPPAWPNAEPEVLWQCAIAARTRKAGQRA